MDEEAGNSYLERLDPDADGVRGDEGVEGDDVPVLEWMVGLPSSDDLTPLSQLLVSPELAAAFSIPAPEIQSMVEVHRAVQMTISKYARYQNQLPSSPAADPQNRLSVTDKEAEETMLLEAEDPKEFSSPRKVARFSDPADGSSAGIVSAVFEGDSSSNLGENSVEDNTGRMLKRTRLVWTPQLHKRFVDVVAHLGIKNAVPKTIMQLMNVDGLTRENVASHLQKYRLYLKRVQGLSTDDPSPMDVLFASTPEPQSVHEQQIPAPMPYAVPTMLHRPVYNMPRHQVHGLVPVNNQGVPLYNGFVSHHPYAPNDWSGGSNIAPFISYPYVSPNDK